MWFQSSKAIILDYMLLEVGTMRKRSKVSVIVAIAVIIAGAGAFYLVSPLFISTQVNEPLPTSVLQSESYQRFISMNEEEKMQAAKQMSSQERDTIMTVAARINNSIDESMDQTLVQQQQPQNITALTNTTPNILRTGSFVGAGDGIHNAERLENLRVTNGPDLYVYLATDKSASDFVSLGKLKANNGNQNYNIPSEIDLTKYDTILIWCRPFSVLFGSAELAVT